MCQLNTGSHIPEDYFVHHNQNLGLQKVWLFSVQPREVSKYHHNIFETNWPTISSEDLQSFTFSMLKLVKNSNILRQLGEYYYCLYSSSLGRQTIRNRGTDYVW